MNKTQQLIPGKLYRLNRHLYIYPLHSKDQYGGTRINEKKLITFLYKKKIDRFSVYNFMHYFVLYENILGTIAWYQERDNNFIETFLELVE